MNPARTGTLFDIPPVVPFPTARPGMGFDEASAADDWEQACQAAVQVSERGFDRDRDLATLLVELQRDGPYRPRCDYRALEHRPE